MEKGFKNYFFKFTFSKVTFSKPFTESIEIKAFVMPNSETSSDEDLHDYLCPIDAIERSSGLIFFNNLFKQKFGKQITKVNNKTAVDSKGLLW